MARVSEGLRQALIEEVVAGEDLDLDVEEFSRYVGRLQAGELVPIYRWQIAPNRVERFEGSDDDWLLLGADNVLRTIEQVEAELAADAGAGRRIWGARWEEQLFTRYWGGDRG
jgi:hypothetical protein